MSGGRFEYRDSSFDYIASELEADIEGNDNVETGEWNEPGYIREGNHSSVRTIKYMRMMVDDLHRLSDLLHAYDLYVSDDTCEDDFLEKAEEIYGDNNDR